MKSVIVILLLIAEFFLLILLVKNDITCRMHLKINDAIFAYKMARLGEYDFEGIDIVEFSDAENYDKTLFRIWDWGYTRLLPKDKYELIKDYIQ